MINFLCTSPKPHFESTDALYNEIEVLRKRFKGSVTSLHPFASPSSRYPILLYGMHNIGRIRGNERLNSINHIYAPSIFHFPMIHFLKKPIIYSVFAGISPDIEFPVDSFMKRIHSFIVSNERDLKILKDKGISNVEIIRPAIETKKFDKHSLPLKKTLHFLMASAPWELKQYESKGIHLMLQTLQKVDDLHITFLWRNIFPEHMIELIQKYDVVKKVTFINEFADVSALLKKSHGALLLTNDCTVVKAYPSSIIETITAGKPVIISKEIPIADFIVKNDYGLTLDEYTVDDFVKVLKEFRQKYSHLSEATLKFSPDEFSTARMLADYEHIYNNIEVPKGI